MNSREFKRFLRCQAHKELVSAAKTLRERLVRTHQPITFDAAMLVIAQRPDLCPFGVDTSRLAACVMQVETDVITENVPPPPTEVVACP